MGNNSELLRYSYNDDITVYLGKVSHLFRLLSDRGLMGLNEINKSHYITEENNAIVFLFRNAIAYVDSISEVVKIPSVECLKIIARSFFEIKCYLEYIFKENTHERAVAYQVYYIRERIKMYKKLDQNTEMGKEFSAKWLKDSTFSSMERIHYDTKKAIANLEKQLSRSPFKEVNDKYDNITKKYEWFTFDSGKKDLINLCEYLNCQVSYDIFYRSWSGIVHSTTVYVDNLITNGSTGRMQAIRSLNGFKNIITILFPLISSLYLNVFESIVPDFHDRFTRFYKNIFYPKRKEVESYKIDI